MRRTYDYVAVTKDAAQRSKWTFYEAVKIDTKRNPAKRETKGPENTALKDSGKAKGRQRIFRKKTIDNGQSASGHTEKADVSGVHLAMTDLDKLDEEFERC